MAEKLKPCPFCGKEPILEEVKIANAKGYFVKCKCGTEQKLYKSKINAIKKWNRRAADSSKTSSGYTEKAEKALSKIKKLDDHQHYSGLYIKSITEAKK